jgi:hypothetical protein
MGAGDVAPGTVLGGRYRLERVLGVGGMGTVWAVEDLETGARRALKLVNAEGEGDGAAGATGSRRRFLREARAASAVQHPNVVTIYDVLDRDDAPPALVMELLDGESLRARLDRDGALPLDALADVLVPVISAVGAAHALGVVHRDLKPENIFLAGGVVKVLDFGIAKLTTLDDEAMRSTGLTTGVLGTPAYMAPEQVFGEHDLDHRVDIWALGILVYEALAGECPTRGANVGQVLKHVVSLPFTPIEERVAGLPRELAALVARMLTRDRDGRPDLHEVLAVLGPHARHPAPSFGPPLAPAAAARRERSTATQAARPPSPVLPARRRRRPLVAVAGITAIAIVVAIGAWQLRPRSRAANRSRSPSPLAVPTATLGCPVLHVTGATEPAGWLGAAAAAIACERARVVLGGGLDRVLAPAALLELPRGPVDEFPKDPFDQPGARDRTLAAARHGADAYLDGVVRWSADGPAVTLALHRADGTELATATGEGRALYEAVRGAMDGLVAADQLPRAAALDPAIAAWARTSDVDAALGALDLAFAFAHNAGQLPAECERFAALGPRLRELDAEGRWLCAYTLGRAAPDVRVDEADASDAAVATRIRVAHELHQTERPGDAARIHAMLAREPTARGRSLLAVTESCLLGSTDPQAARELAILAVQSDPTNADGGWCSPWVQLLTLERDTPAAAATVRAMQAWQPWDSAGWREPGYETTVADDGHALVMLRRAYLLSPFDSQIASTLATSLLAAGDRAAARGIAVALRTGGLPLHDVGSQLLLVRIEASEASFGAALERARGGARLSPDDAGWLRAQRFELGWRALELGVLLGRGRELADALVAEFVTPDPAPLHSNVAVNPIRIPAICARSSAPAPCFARFRALRPQLTGAITADTQAFVAGAERYVAKDYAAAAAAWRPLLDGRLVLASALPDAMADAFERTGAPELAARVDDEVMKRANELHGATLGHVRAARRAFARGDHVRARELAAAVVEAWALADPAPPALDEMRALVTRIDAR